MTGASQQHYCCISGASEAADFCCYPLLRMCVCGSAGWVWGGKGGGWSGFGFFFFFPEATHCFDFLPRWLNHSVLLLVWKKQFVRKTNRRGGRITVRACWLQIDGSKWKVLFLTSSFRVDTGGFLCLWHVTWLFTAMFVWNESVQVFILHEIRAFKEPYFRILQNKPIHFPCES